jgi:hypothetical protein
MISLFDHNLQHPTRKMYMLFHLEPSVELTGGPWYSENELDTEFIRLLSRACLQFIRDKVHCWKTIVALDAQFVVPSSELSAPEEG